MQNESVRQETSAREEITQAYARYAECMRQGDLAGIMALLTPDFTWHLLDGQALSRTETEAELRALFQTSTIPAMQISIEAFASDGTQAEVCAVERYSMHTPDGGPGKTVLMLETVREQWHKTEAGFRIAESALLSSETRQASAGENL